MRLFSKLPPKFRLSLPIVTGIVVSVVLITVFSVHKTRKNIYQSVERNLVLEVETIKRMFERERDLKLAKVKNDLRVAHELFYGRELRIADDGITVHATNQITARDHEARIARWTLDGRDLFLDTAFVDRIHSLVGGTSTIFQRIDSGYMRLSTNVRMAGGARAVGTFIPNSSEVARAVSGGSTFIGRAFVVNDWYITAYEPIRMDDAVVGMLYVGDLEKDLGELRSKLVDLRIGESGFPFVIDESGAFIIHPTAEGERWSEEPLIKQMMGSASGITRYRLQADPREKLVAWDHFEDFRLIIAAAVPLAEETAGLVREVIINSAVIGLVIIVAFSIFAYFVTTENVRKFLAQLEHSSRRLRTAERALEQSERHFQTLFNSSSDDIFVIDFNGNYIEVNQGACDNLGYSREEFLAMNVRDIKPPHHKEQVESNILMIRRFGQHRYETENQARDGRIIPVEMKSRVIEYRGRQVILSISRDISERKEVEDKILSTIIRTEEKERKRFAADLHDDLAPILSTIKLYTDLLKKKNYRKISEEEAIRNIDELVDMSIASTRAISRNIRPNILQDFGLAAAVNDFCSFIRKTESVEIEVVTHQYTIEHRGIEESVLYQAVKELINNTLKHAAAKNIKVELKSFGNQVILYYRDNGNGFDLEEALASNSGLGLNNIVNKIKSVKGTVDINTRPGDGMFLVASVKVKDK